MLNTKLKLKKGKRGLDKDLLFCLAMVAIPVIQFIIFYVIVNFKSAPDFPAELERIFGITEGIMRSVVIKLDEKMLAKKAARAAQAKTEAVEEKAEEAAEATDAE